MLSLFLYYKIHWFTCTSLMSVNSHNKKLRDKIATLIYMTDIFNSAPWRKRSHGHRHYTSPIFLLVCIHLNSDL